MIYLVMVKTLFYLGRSAKAEDLYLKLLHNNHLV